MSTRDMAALAGVGGALLVALLLSPKACADTDPPICESAFGYFVPAGGWWIAASLAAALLVGWSVTSAARRVRAQ